MQTEIIIDTNTLNKWHSRICHRLTYYKEYLDIMKPFIGENNPLILRFETLLKGLISDLYDSYSEIKALNATINPNKPT